MSGLIGVRRAGDARIIFVQTVEVISAGDTAMVETEDGSFAATVAIATDQLPECMPPVKVEGTASRIDSECSTPDNQSREDERYRIRKQRFPALGQRLPQGTVIRTDLRHESFDFQDDRGQVSTVALHATSDSPS